MKKIFDFGAFCVNEALSIAPEELKDAFKRDMRMKPLLSKDVKFEDLSDPADTFAAVKGAFFNNQQVVQYYKQTKAFSPWIWEFNQLRQLRPEKFGRSEFRLLLELLSKFFQQASKRGRAMLSTDAKKAIENWINASGRYNRRLSEYQIEEIESIPGLRPDGPVKLYRGLLWKEYDLRNGRDGRKFVDAIRNGSGVVDYHADRHESWTLSKDVADRFAVAGPADSEFGAMLNWLQKAKSGDKIEGELGVIVAVLAQPDDVLADLSRIGNRLNTRYGWEDEVILKPGKYVCKIVRLYNRKGEITVQEFLDSLYSNGEAEQLVSDFRKDFYPKLENLINRQPVRLTLTKMYNPSFIKFAIENRDDIIDLTGQLIEWSKRMRFDQSPPKLTAGSTEADERMKRIYVSFWPVNGKRGKLLYQFSDVHGCVVRTAATIQRRCQTPYAAGDAG